MADATGDGGQSSQQSGGAKQPLSYRAWKKQSAAAPVIAPPPPAAPAEAAKVSTSGNNTTVDAPMATGGTGETVQVGAKKADKPAEILSVTGEGAKKTGANQAELGGDTEFEMDLPTVPGETQEPEPDLTPEEQLADDEAAKNDAGYQQYLNDFARDQAAADAQQNAQAQAAEQPEEPSEPDNEIDQARARSAAKTAGRPKPTSTPEIPAENSEDAMPEEPSADAQEPSNEGEGEAEDEGEGSEGEGAESAPPDAEPEPKAEPVPEKAATPAPPVNAPATTPQTPATPPQLSFDEQAARANQLAAEKAKDRSADEKKSDSAQTDSKTKEPKKSIKQRTGEGLKKLNPVTNAKQAINDRVNNVKNGFNNATKPLKSIKNLGELRRLNQAAKANEKKQQELGKKIKEPQQKIKRLEWKRRAYRTKQSLYSFLIFAYFGTVLPVILLLIGIGEGILGSLVRAWVKARMRIKAIKKEIDALKELIAADQETILKLEAERQEIAQAKVRLTQVFPTTKRQQSPESQSSNKKAAAASPWNAPGDFNQNLMAANDNAIPRQAANDNGINPANEEPEQKAA